MAPKPPLASADVDAAAPMRKKTAAKAGAAADGKENNLPKAATGAGNRKTKKAGEAKIAAEGSAEEAAPVATASSELQQETSEVAATQAGPSNKKASAKPTDNKTRSMEFWTMCRPRDDISAQKRAEDSDYDSEEDESEEEESEDGTRNERARTVCGRRDCMCKKPAAEHPEHKWIISENGYKMTAKLQHEALTRDQDAMDSYQYNDFSGYGFQEVVENHLLSFKKKYSKKKKDPWELWEHIEAFAHFLPGPGDWFMIDSADKLLATLELIGYTIVATLDVLEEQGLFKPDSPVKDIALVLGLLLQLGSDWPGDPGEPQLSWSEAIVERLDKHGIQLAGAPVGIEKQVEEIRAELAANAEDDSDNESQWDGFLYEEKFKEFCAEYGTGKGHQIGGHAHVLT